MIPTCFKCSEPVRPVEGRSTFRVPGFNIIGARGRSTAFGQKKKNELRQFNNTLFFIHVHVKKNSTTLIRIDIVNVNM